MENQVDSYVEVKLTSTIPLEKIKEMMSMLSANGVEFKTDVDGVTEIIKTSRATELIDPWVSVLKQPKCLTQVAFILSKGWKPQSQTGAAKPQALKAQVPAVVPAAQGEPTRQHIPNALARAISILSGVPKGLHRMELAKRLNIHYTYLTKLLKGCGNIVREERQQYVPVTGSNAKSRRTFTYYHHADNFHSMRKVTAPKAAKVPVASGTTRPKLKKGKKRVQGQGFRLFDQPLRLSSSTNGNIRKCLEEKGDLYIRKTKNGRGMFIWSGTVGQRAMDCDPGDSMRFSATPEQRFVCHQFVRRNQTLVSMLKKSGINDDSFYQRIDTHSWTRLVLTQRGLALIPENANTRKPQIIIEVEGKLERGTERLKTYQRQSGGSVSSAPATAAPAVPA